MTLNDPLWPTLIGGCRQRYDASVPLRTLVTCPDDALPGLWDGLWEELYHQEDVDTASYAAVAPLVGICIARELLDDAPFLLIATIESRRGEDRNPDVPDGLATEYFAGLDAAIRYLSARIDQPWHPELVAAFLGLVAARKGYRHVLPLLLDYGPDEVAEMIALYNGEE